MLAPAAASAAQPTPRELNRQIAEQQLKKLKDENGAPLHDIGGIAGLVAWITAIGGIVGLLLRWDRDRSERKHQREQDRDQRVQAAEAARREQELDRQQRDEAARAAWRQRERDRLQREEAQFVDASTKLASEQPGLQAAGAAALEAFLVPQRVAYRDRLLSLLTAMAKVDHAEAIALMIARLLARLMAVHSLALRKRADGGPVELDLEAANLPRVNLAHAFLRGSNLARARLPDSTLESAVLNDCDITGIELPYADLTGAFLRQVRSGDPDQPALLFHTTLDSARLTSADLRWAQCSATTFRDAALQDLDLRNATLEDVNFTGADVRGTDFRRAEFKGTTLSTLLRTDAWRDAKLDDEVRNFLEGADE